MTADYVYDGLERLAIRTTQNMTPAGTTHYVYDLGGRLIAEANDTGQTLREYVWLDEMPLTVIADVNTMSPQLWFVHADHLDRPVRMTDGSQAVVWDAVYRPFGGAVSITGSASNNLRFPGQYFLLESGLHYNWHRHYDPTTGRYLQADPLGFVDGPSLYAYALSAPTQTVDPAGGAAIRSRIFDPLTMGPEMGGGGGRGGFGGGGRQPRITYQPQPPAPGGTPSDWICRPSSRGGGWRYENPSNPSDWVRVMPGNPKSPNPSQQEPYVVRHRSSQYIGEFGNVVPGNSPAAHVPLSRFKFYQ